MSIDANIRNLKGLMKKIEKDNEHLLEIGEWAYENGLIRDGYYALANEVAALEAKKRLDQQAADEAADKLRQKTKHKPNLPW